MTEPTEEDLHSPVFNVIWAAIKKWEISREPDKKGIRLFHGPTGTDVMAILTPLREAGLVIENVVDEIGKLDA